MPWIAFLAATANAPTSPVTASVQARATIRILNGAGISKESWKQQGRSVERIVRTPDGRSYKLRITDFE